MSEEINHAVRILREGGLVAFPTETVYGLGADAKNPDALRKIFLAKQRPMDHPVIVHLSDIHQIAEWAKDVSTDAFLLAKTFWPGPLTLILKKKDGVSDLVTGGQNSIGLRMPNHPVARELLHAFGSGLAAPSANRFGHISPTTASAVREELGDTVNCILDGGSCEVGVESTIIDVSGDEASVLRPGMITVREIEAVLGKSVGVKKKDSPRVSGAMESHYAPDTETRVVSEEVIDEWMNKSLDKRMVILSRRQLGKKENRWIEKMPENVREYAHVLYETLRRVDKEEFDGILIEEVPEGVEWDGVRDRLGRMPSQP